MVNMNKIKCFVGIHKYELKKHKSFTFYVSTNVLHQGYREMQTCIFCGCKDESHVQLGHYRVDLNLMKINQEC